MRLQMRAADGKPERGGKIGEIKLVSDNTVSAISEIGAIIEEVNRFLADGPSAVEVDRAKAQFEREWLDQLGRFDSRADLIVCYATLYGDPELINRRLDEVLGVTVTQVAEAARRYLRPEHCAVLSYREETA